MSLDTAREEESRQGKRYKFTARIEELKRSVVTMKEVEQIQNLFLI